MPRKVKPPAEVRQSSTTRTAPPLRAGASPLLARISCVVDALEADGVTRRPDCRFRAHAFPG
ncbi:MAG TPA: hypothetical protein VFZ18_02525 [Longimicrobiaceae bacterium]